MNGANEVAVAAFLAARCGYLDIVRTPSNMRSKKRCGGPNAADYAAADGEARRMAANF